MLYHKQINHKEKSPSLILAKRFMVSRPTIYNVLKKARMKLFVPLTSKNECYKTICYGIKRLVKVEKSIEDKLRRQAKCYNKTYPREILHVDTNRLPLLKN